MKKDAIAFLDGETVEEPENEEVEEVTQPEPAEAEAPAEPEAQTGEDEVEPPSTEPKESDRIPVTALLDEREKRQEAQRKAEEADRRLKALEAESRRLQKPQETPDWYEDPQKAATYQQQVIEQRLEQRRMEQSKFFAEREFGADTVGEAVAHFDKHPEQSRQFLSHPSPFHAAVEFYKKQKLADEIGSDPDAYRKRIAEELREQLLAEMSQSQPSKPKAPPPSMAKAPTVGKEAMSSGSAFDSLFPE